MGMRRLSIIDLDTGHQPISDAEGTIWTVCNGEIYNFREIRRDLAAAGARFRTGSDTEVLVHLYQRLGPSFVGRLLGMFGRSEEHTSELQSLMRISYAVFCLNTKTNKQSTIYIKT